MTNVFLPAQPLIKINQGTENSQPFLIHSHRSLNYSLLHSFLLKHHIFLFKWEVKAPFNSSSFNFRYSVRHPLCNILVVLYTFPKGSIVGKQWPPYTFWNIHQYIIYHKWKKGWTNHTPLWCTMYCHHNSTHILTWMDLLLKKSLPQLNTFPAIKFNFISSPSFHIMSCFLYIKENCILKSLFWL